MRLFRFWSLCLLLLTGGHACGRDFASPLDFATDGSVLAVEAGDDHNCTLVDDGSVWCWGRNGLGQLGSVTEDERAEIPLRVDSELPFVQLSAGGATSCAIDVADRLWCWGLLVNGAQPAPQVTPQRVGARRDRWREVSVGSDHVCAIDGKDRLACWGWNGTGQLGVEADDYVSERTRLPAKRWLSVSAGGGHTCAIDREQALWCWGWQGEGALGNGAHEDAKIFEPQRIPGVWRSVVAGDSHTCGLQQPDPTQHPQLYCWGTGQFGELGVAALETPSPREIELPADIAKAGWSVSRLDAGLVTTCVRRGAEGLWCWGDTHLPGIDTAGAPMRIEGRWDHDVAVGKQHVCATRGGEVWCWGANTHGQLGHSGTGPEKQLPGPVATPWRD